MHDKRALAGLLGSSLRADVDPLNFAIFQSQNIFGFSVERGLHGEQHYLAFLLQGGLGLPDRDEYLENSPSRRRLRVAYLRYIGHTLTAAGFDHTSRRAAAVLELEAAIARVHALRKESEDNQNIGNHWASADFSNHAPGLDWPAFFSAADLSNQPDFVVWQPGAITGESALVGSYPLDTWKDYLRFHVMDRYAAVLPVVLAERAGVFHDIGGSDTSKQVSREQRAMNATGEALPELLGRMYVEEYFSAQMKAKLESIVAHVIDAFKKRIESIQWMAPETKKLALLKLKTMYFGVAYPERWSDYSTLIIDSRDAVGNLRRVAEWNYHNALLKLKQPVDPAEWITPPQAVAAYFIPQHNGYNFAAALLQPPKFDAASSDAANYGSIGAICGHEISHFVDLLGAENGARGELQHWWTKEDKAHFDAVSEGLAAQFSRYRPFPDLPINGERTLSENIADLGGLEAAFDAYRQTLGDKINDKNYVRQQDRQFFLAFARAWRAEYRPDALRAQVATDDHAPESFRVSTVRNVDAWYDAFDVGPSQRLYLEPQARVHIW